VQITYKPLTEIFPYKNNPRHNDAAVEPVARSIREFGFKVPIVIDRAGVIVAGHTRYKAARSLGLTEVPCIVADDLSDEQIRSFRLVDNRTAEIAEWDIELLNLELGNIVDIDMTLFGFELEPDTPSEAVEDEFDQEPPEEPVTRSGNIWRLGDHHLMCGDSADAASVARLMDGARADMVFTDPPYGVSIGDKNKMLKGFQHSSAIEENMENDTLPPEELYKILRAAFENVKANLNDCAAVYVTAPQGGSLGIMMLLMMRDAGLEVRHTLIWVKNQATFSLGRLDYDYQHEPIFFTWNKTHKKVMTGDYKTSCWFIDKPRENKLHPTMKPIGLIANALLNSSEAGDTVLDVFGGSGSTLIACEQLGRKCFMMEIDPKYCDVIVKRWEQLTGRTAELVT